MQQYRVTVTRTETFKTFCDIDVMAKDEDSACRKAKDRIDKARAKAKTPGVFNEGDFLWELIDDDDKFQYQAGEV